MTKYAIDEVKEITLISIEEWEKAKLIPTVPKYTSQWWLRSPGYSNLHAANVIDDGSVYTNGDLVDNTLICVRPAFKISNLKSKIGDKVFVENILCTVIDDGYILSDSVICRHRFDEKINEYEKSEIKQYINSDEFKKLL